MNDQTDITQNFLGELEFMLMMLLLKKIIYMGQVLMLQQD